jgi:formylglycine-generating enzyme required for sulfatase activity
MTLLPRRRWPIIVSVCLLLCSAALPLAGAPAPADDEITNSIGMKLKRIKAGKFLMGSPKGEADRSEDEGPRHEVEVTRSFYIGFYPVTKGQFAAFVRDDGYKTEAEKNGDEHTWQKPYFRTKYDQTDDDPVVEVSWDDAVKFCAWLSKKEKKTYDLPTEAEWEYACRAGTTTAFSFGHDPKALGDYAWYSDNSGGHTHPVGGKKPNPWGLYDMHGNAWQWCADRWGKYQEGYFKDPKDTDSDQNPVLRGGSWADDPVLCRSAYRNSNPTGRRVDDNGFRVVLRPD